MGPDDEPPFSLMTSLMLLPRSEPAEMDVYWRFKEELQVEAMLRVACLFSAARMLNSQDTVRCFCSSSSSFPCSSMRKQDCRLARLPREILALIFNSWLRLDGPAAFRHRHDLDMWIAHRAQSKNLHAAMRTVSIDTDDTY
jgi:hypothetical protein